MVSSPATSSVDKCSPGLFQVYQILTVNVEIFTLCIFLLDSRYFKYPCKYVHHESYFCDSIKSQLHIKRKF